MTRTDDHKTMTSLQALSLFADIEPDLEAVVVKMRQAAEVEFETLGEAMSYLVDGRGKLIRPALVILASQMWGANQDAMISMAAAVETLHTATLVHDDMIDRSLLRRGNSTLNAILSPGAVVLIGDYLFAQSAAWAAETNNMRVMSVFAKTLMVICDGELRQMLSSRDWQRSRRNYTQRIYAKTASLFAAATEAGAVLAGAPEEAIRALRTYGEKLGLAFQIVDDLLDFDGDEETLGKPVGSDLRQGNITLPVIYYLEEHPANSLGERIISDQELTDDEVQAVVSAVRRSSALDRSLADAVRYAKEAQQALKVLPVQENREIMHALADYAVLRRR